MSARTIAAALLVAAGAVRADEWSTTDRALLAGAAALHLADWSQTLRIAEPGGWYEKNRILGPDPSRSDVNAYFAGTAVLLLVLASALPEYRTALLTGWITVGIVSVGNNLALGIRIGF